MGHFLASLVCNMAAALDAVAFVAGKQHLRQKVRKLKPSSFKTEGGSDVAHGGLYIFQRTNFFIYIGISEWSLVLKMQWANILL